MKIYSTRLGALRLPGNSPVMPGLFSLLLIALFLLSAGVAAQNSEPSVQWTSTVNVGTGGGPGVGLADWLYDVIVTSSGNYLAVGFANENEGDPAQGADKPAYCMISAAGHLLKDGVIDQANPTGDRGRLYAVTETSAGYFAVGNFDGQGILVRIDKNTLDHTFTLYSGIGRMNDILDVPGGQYLLASAQAGGNRWLMVLNYDMVLLHQFELPGGTIDDRMEAMQYVIEGNNVRIYFAGKEVISQMGGFGSYRRWDSDVRVGSILYNHTDGTVSVTPGFTHNSINQGPLDDKVVEPGDVPAALAGTIFENPENQPTKVDRYPYGPMYRNFPFERNYDNCSEKEMLNDPPGLKFIEDWSDGSEDEPYSLEVTDNYVVVSAMLNKIIMWSFTNDALGGDLEGGLRCEKGECTNYDGDDYLWGEGYLLFFNKSDLTFHHARHLGTFTGADFNVRMVKTPNGGFAVVGTATGCPEGESEVKAAEHMMVVQTDAEGNILWRKHFGATGEGACGFGITVTPDGGLMVVGNTYDDGLEGEENLCFIKLGSGCEYEADIVPNQGRDYVLSGNETWNTDRNVRARVVVPSGIKLVISGNITIRFADSRETYDYNDPGPIGILVQAGGSLFVNSATLTGYDCEGNPKMWDGINVEGRPTLTQTITDLPANSPVGNQGYCRLLGAKIMNARAGVVADAVWSGVYPPIVTTYAGTQSTSLVQTSTLYHGADRGGARIWSLGSRFINNRRDAIFMRYPHNWNTSRFQFTYFTNDGPLVDDNMIVQPAPNDYNSTNQLGTSIHVSVWSTRVSFSSCTFSGSTQIVPAQRPIGIGGYDARLVVSGGSMTDQKIGIESATATGGILANVNASGVTFTNQVQGITLRNSAFDVVSGCHFLDIPPQSLVVGMTPCGIFGQYSRATTILNNDFTGSGKSIGVVMHNTQYDGADIRENEFFSSRVGNQFEGDNSELIARCNDYTGHSEAAWTVLIDQNGNQGLHDQGAPGAFAQKADNEFFDLCGLSSGDSHILSEVEFGYFDKTGNPHPAEADCVSDVVNYSKEQLPTPLGCLTPDPPCDPPCDRLTQYYASPRQLRDRNIAIRGLIHTGADSNDELLPSRYDDALAVLTDRAAYAADRTLLVGSYYQMGNYTSARNQLNLLPATTTQNAAYAGFLDNLLDASTDVMGVSGSYYQNALTYLDDAGTSSQAMAQSLHYLRDEVYHPLEALEPGVGGTDFHRAGGTAVELPDDVRITPNPFNGRVQFALNGLDATQRYQVDVFDPLGRLTWSQQGAGGEMLIWDGSGVSDGMYIYRVSAQGVCIRQGKLSKTSN